MNRILSYCLIFGMVSQAVAFSAGAYSIPNHTFITKRAVDEYTYCAPILKLPELPKDAGESLKNGNLGEDLAIFRKFVNWHLYNPNKALGSIRSMVGRVGRLETQMRKKPSWKVLGGILHYVQDVTNPAHVAPVFHTTADCFDNFPFDSNVWLPFSADRCKAIYQEPSMKKGYWENIDAVAKETLARIEQPFLFTRGGVAQIDSWSHAFWDPQYTSKGNNGLGAYGVFGNRFGVADFGNVKVDSGDFLEFAATQIHSALDASLLLIEKYAGTLHE